MPEPLGEAYEAAIAQLQSIWGVTERQLVELGLDRELLLLVGAGNVPLSQAHAATLARRVRTSLAELRASSRAWAVAAVTEQVAAGTRASTQSMILQGAEPAIIGALGQANTGLIAALVEEIAIDTDFAASASERTLRRHFRLTQQSALAESAITASLAISEARIEDSNQTSKRLARELSQAVGEGKLIQVNNRRYTPEVYAGIVASTRLAEAASAAAINVSLASGQDLVQISDHGASDPVCDAFAGKVFSVSGQDKRFPPLKEQPPYHPNCKHRMLPFVSELKSANELEFAIARSRDRVPVGTSINQFREVLSAAV